MGLGRFVLYTALGTVAWTATLTIAGYVLASRFENVSNYVGVVSTAVLVCIGIWYVYRLLKYFLRHPA
jgi:membrane protein DedA with SNARE-associated domain